MKEMIYVRILLKLQHWTHTFFASLSPSLKCLGELQTLMLDSKELGRATCLSLWHLKKEEYCPVYLGPHWFLTMPPRIQAWVFLETGLDIGTVGIMPTRHCVQLHGQWVSGVQVNSSSSILFPSTGGTYLSLQNGKESLCSDHCFSTVLVYGWVALLQS